MAFKIINNDVIRPQKRWGWRVVKGGWRVCDTLHLYKYLCIRHLYRIGEGWRVFLKVAFYPPAAWNFHPVFSTPGAKIHNRKGVSKFSSLSHAHSAPFGKNPKGVWEKAWENRADFFSFTGKHLVIMMEKRKFADWLRNFVSQTIHDHRFPSPLYGR